MEKSKPTWLIYVAMFVAFVWLDRFLKNLVSSRMQIGEAWPSRDAFAAIRYTINEGVSFSLFSGHPTALIVLQSALFIVIAAVLFAAYRRGMHAALLTGLCWIVAGGAGNLIDRIRYHYVIDFISVGSFPVWNFADMCIVGGCIVAGVYMIFFYGRAQ
ncbi:MAG: signal peptidase II [Clostridiales Family XIII bacterium]|nr:signal peptidase II [Clostridiales Family XIII bacterium]